MLYKTYIKSSLDFVLSSLGLIVLLPILFITAILIKLESSGPIFFRQKRLGKNGQVFEIYKFRSMTNKSRDFRKQIFEGNSEITFIGKYIRRLKIDELPQLINVVRGEMSLVGPRPCLPEQLSEFNEDGRKRLEVKPGCTNLAAVNGSIYLTWPERWVYDRYYVENLSLFLDLEIVIKTMIVMVFGEKVFLKGKNEL